MMIVLCCVVLYDYVHCLLLRRNNKYINRFALVSVIVWFRAYCCSVLHDDYRPDLGP